MRRLDARLIVAIPKGASATNRAINPY